MAELIDLAIVANMGIRQAFMGGAVLVRTIPGAKTGDRAKRNEMLEVIKTIISNEAEDDVGLLKDRLYFINEADAILITMRMQIRGEEF